MNDSELHLSSFEWHDVEHKEPMIAVQIGPLACSCFVLPEDGPETSTLLDGSSALEGSNHVCQLTASELVMKEHFGKLLVQVQIYRMLELIASILFLGVMTWILQPFAILIPVVVFWYLPPSYAVGSYTKILLTPFAMFAVKCSLVGIGAKATFARNLFIIGITRVISLSLVPLLVLLLPMPVAVTDVIMHKDAFHAFLGERVGGWRMADFRLWFTCGVIICLASFMWVALTFLILRGRLWRSSYTPLYEEQDEFVLKKIEDLSMKLRKACALPPQDCRLQLETLKSSTPHLKLVSTLSVVSGVGSVLADTAGVFWNAITCFRAGFVFSGLFIGGYFVYEIKFLLDKGGPSRIYAEMKLSRERGMYTDDAWAILHMMKGAHTAFKLMVKVCSLPWAADGWISGAIAVATIAHSLQIMAKYAFEKYDLGGETVVPRESTSPNDAGDPSDPAM